MSTNFGFVPVKTGRRYFISYKSEDTLRVGEISRALNQMGVPVWYDDGIEYGKPWSVEINKQLEECDAVLLFATRSLFYPKEKMKGTFVPYVRTEYDIAKGYNKDVYVIWLDDVAQNEAHRDIVDWYIELKRSQGIEAFRLHKMQIAPTIVNKLNLIRGLAPQPSSHSVNQIPLNQPYYPSRPKNGSKTGYVVFGVLAAVLLVCVVSVVVAVITNNNRSDSSDDGYSFFSDDDDDETSDPFSSDIKKSSSGIGDVSEGSTVYFGEYPQSSSSSSDPIKWRVLKTENGRALLISDMLLDCVKYNSNCSVTWEDSSIRRWLNSDFMNKAFSQSEQEIICDVTISNPSNSKFDTYGGNSTTDSVFLLSEEEARNYFDSDEDRKCVATSYARSRGSAINEKETDFSGRNTSWWWLRTPGEKTNYAAHVRGSGEVYPSGSIVSYAKGSVRPAMWVLM